MNNNKDNTFLVDTITNAIKLPGVKVNRNEFLVKVFSDADNDRMNTLLANGPIEAGYSHDDLKRRAKRLVNERTLASSGVSFAAGLPGGIAMAGTIPADTLQFYGFSLRLAQEIAYIYGADDLWNGGDVDLERVTNQLVLYCGVMFGVSGSAATLKLMTAALSKQATKKIPQKALTKTIYYPIIKRISTIFGVRMTKDVFAKGVSKVIPIVGGVISGGMTLASMRPMGFRLVTSFDEALFDYTEEDYNLDLEEVMDIVDADIEVTDNLREESVGKKSVETVALEDTSINFAEKIKEAKILLDDGILNEDEFAEIKQKLIAKL